MDDARQDVELIAGSKSGQKLPANSNKTIA
jgi:hypothetical protein